MLIKTVSGLELGGRVTAPHGCGITVESGQTVEVVFKFKASLAPGTYFLNAGLVELRAEGEVFLERWVDAAVFKILPGDVTVAGPVDFSIEPSLFVDNLEISEKEV